MASGSGGRDIMEIVFCSAKDYDSAISSLL